MIAGPSHARLLSAAALTGALLLLITGCDAAGSTSSEVVDGRGTDRWEEPAAYIYTLTSTTQVLAGAFRVEVRNGATTKVVGLDEDSRRLVRDQHAEVPTIGGLLKRLEQARSEHAATAEVKYASDGHPVRIALDWDKNAIDDEALYVISDYEPSSAD